MQKVTICKDKDNPYLMMNKTALKDNRLSWKAKGLIAYLLSLPDDWVVYVEEIATHSKDGIKSTYAGLKELIENGYIKRIQLKDEKGLFKGSEYIVYEMPINIDAKPTQSESPKTENRKTACPKTPTTNNNITNNKLTNNKEEEEVIQSFVSLVGRKARSHETTALKKLLLEHNKDLVLKAISEMSLNAERISIKYLTTTLNDWKSKGLSTLEEVEMHLNEFEALKNKAKENRNNNIKKQAEKTTKDNKTMNDEWRKIFSDDIKKEKEEAEKTVEMEDDENYVWYDDEQGCTRRTTKALAEYNGWNYYR